jgi:Na+/H+ antiporter NhaD/arsenite permease-like protein
MRRAHHPLALLAAVTAVAGVFSAFLVNDAICLVLAPLVLELTLSLRRNPVPYLLVVAMASNIGSTATISSFSQIPYGQLTAYTAAFVEAAVVATMLSRCSLS